MKKTIAIASLVLLAACSSHDESPLGKRRSGAIPLGPQPVAITLLSGTNANQSLAPNGVAPSTIVRFTPASGGSTISGFDATSASDGDMYVVRNVSNTDSITLTNADSSSLAKNQLLLSSAGSVVLPPQSSIFIEWDKTAGEWVQGPGHINSPTFNGTVTTSSASVAQGIELVTSGALSLSKGWSQLSVTGTQAYTLPNGTVTGTIKTIECTVAASTPVGTVTITTPAGSEPATHVFNAVGQQLVLQWNGTGWHQIAKLRTGSVLVVVGTTVLTGFDMQETYNLSVTGTVSSTSTLAIPACWVPMERIHVATSVAASTPVGNINIPGTTVATFVAATNLAAINATSVQADFVCIGNGSGGWQNTSLTTATYSFLEPMFRAPAPANDNTSIAIDDVAIADEERAAA